MKKQEKFLIVKLQQSTGTVMENLLKAKKYTIQQNKTWLKTILLFILHQVETVHHMQEFNMQVNMV